MVKIRSKKIAILFFNFYYVLRVDTRTNMKERSKQGIRLQYNADL